MRDWVRAVLQISSLTAGVVLGSACESKSSDPPAQSSVAPAQVSAPPIVAKPSDPASASHARREFELLSRDYSGGTSKLYSRGAFLPLDDPNAMSEGDFLGRLRALFGPVEDDRYVLRHRATGFIITAYSAQSGPSYGGGPRYQGKPLEGSAALDHLFDGEARAARIKADPVLAMGRPSERSTIDHLSLTGEQLQEIRRADHVWMKRMYDVAAPPGFDKVVARLDELVSSVLPADWEETRIWAEEPSVYRVGARNGKAFSDALGVTEGLDELLVRAERGQTSLIDTSSGIDHGPNRQVIDYWTYHVAHGQRLDAALPRVQAAWFRHVEEARRESEDVRTLLLERARTDIPALKLDARKAEAALSAPPIDPHP